MAIKYVKNTDDATIICRIASDKKRKFVFNAKKMNKNDGTVLSNGYTEVSDEDLAILKEESTTFNYYVKLKKITVVDNLPFESMSVEQLVIALRAENALLKKASGKGSSAKVVKELNDLKAENDELKEVIAKQAGELASMDSSDENAEELAEALTKIAEQEKVIEALDSQLVVAVEESMVVNAEEKE